MNHIFFLYTVIFNYSFFQQFTLMLGASLSLCVGVGVCVCGCVIPIVILLYSHTNIGKDN